MPISEVKLMLHGGSSQNSIIDEVKRRHIPEKINAAMEIELTESGAKPDHNSGGLYGIIRRGDVTDGYGHVIKRRP